MKKRIILITIIVTLLLSLIGCTPKMTSEEFEEAVRIAKADQAKLGQESEPSLPLLEMLVISDERDVSFDNGYITIVGSVKNVSDKPITYYELTVEFLDKEGNIIASDMVNNSILLKPNVSQEYKIMHRYGDNYKRTVIKVTDVDL